MEEEKEEKECVKEIFLNIQKSFGGPFPFLFSYINTKL